MKKSSRSFLVAEPFLAALEVMSKEMGVDQDTLVNQALFSYARLHGFIVPTVISLETGAPARPAPSAPEAAPTAPPAVAPVTAADMPASAASALAPTALTEAAPPEAPPIDVAALRAVELERMAALAKDVEAWVVPVPPPPDEPDEADDEADEEAGEDDADGGEEDASSDEGDAGDAEPGTEAAAAEEDHGAGEASEAAAPANDEGDAEVPSELTPAGAEDDAPQELSQSGETDVHADAVAAPQVHQEPEEGEGSEDRTMLVRPSSTMKVWVRSDGSDEVQVQPGRFVIGRGDTCHLVINSLRVSREHVSVQIVGKAVIVEDLGSSNGTFFQGQRFERRVVADGDEVLLGNEPVRFRIEA